MATLTVKQAGGGDYTTIDDALQAVGLSAGAGADDIVEVYNGTYTEGMENNIPTGTSWDHPFIVRAAAGQRPVVKNNGDRNITLFTGSPTNFYTRIQGFIFDGTDLSSDNCNINVLEIQLYDNEFINNETENAIYLGNAASAVHVAGNRVHGGLFFTLSNAAQRCHGMYLTASSCTIEYNLFYDITGYGIHQYHDGSPPHPSNNIIRYNRAFRCATDTQVAAGFLVTTGSSNQVYKNLAYDIQGLDTTGGVGIAIGGTSQTVYNNTVYDCSYMGLDLSASTSAIVRNNIAYANGVNIETTGATSLTSSNNVTSDPTFVNIDAADFHLQPSSAAIGAGTNVSLAYFGGAPDAGAFEYFGTQQYNTTTKFYELLLADNSVVSASTSVHCLQPVDGPDGFMTFIKAGNVAQTVARKISTGTEYIISEQTSGMGGGFNQWAHDGSRYIIGARRITHGKQFFLRDLVAFIFDTQAPGWLNFATLGRPTLDIFRGVGSGQKPLCLWVKNGRQVTGFEGSDPLGIVRRFTFITPTLIDFVIEQRGGGSEDDEITSAFLRCQRTFNLALGGMSAIVTVATHTVNPVAPTSPDWLYNGYAA